MALPLLCCLVFAAVVFGERSIVCIYVYIYVIKCVCKYIYTCPCIDVDTYIYVYIFIHIHTYIYMYKDDYSHMLYALWRAGAGVKSEPFVCGSLQTAKNERSIF